MSVTSVHDVPLYSSTLANEELGCAVPPLAKPAVCVPAPVKFVLVVFKLPPAVQLEPSYSPVTFVSGGFCPPNINPAVKVPAAPDSEYGWEKLFSERLYFAYNRNHGIPVRVARYHNIFGPEGTWDGGREKAPAAICRKVARLPEVGGGIEVWGDGLQTRSFLYIDECIEATRRLMDSDFMGPVNIGSEEMVTINQLVETAAKVSGKVVRRIYKLDAPTGVRGRNSNNDLIREKLGWDYSQTLEEGIRKTYKWIQEQIKNQ